MFAPSRDEARRFLTDAWAKYRAGAPLSDQEARAAGIIAQHPEYHATLQAPDRHLDRDYRPEDGAINPFLHISLHVAVAEQIAIDQPPGIRAHFTRLRAAKGDEHEALHTLIDCLAETLWHAQRDGKPPDSAHYLGCLEHQR